MLKFRRQYMLAGLVVLLLLSVTLSIVTAMITQSSNALMSFLIRYHVGVMLVLALVSIGFGFFWASLLQGELRREKRDSHKLLGLLADLLNEEELLIIRMLVESGGKVSQRDIGRHESMTRVKAHRTVSALKQRGVVHTEKKGKLITVYLDEPLLQRMVNPQSS